MNIEKTIPLDQELVNIFGVNDQNLNYLKSLFPKLEINVKNTRFLDYDIIEILEDFLLKAKNRNIYGKVSSKDAEDLKDEGIEVTSIPWIKDDA